MRVRWRLRRRLLHADTILNCIPEGPRALSGARVEAAIGPDGPGPPGFCPGPAAPPGQVEGSAQGSYVVSLPLGRWAPDGVILLPPVAAYTHRPSGRYRSLQRHIKLPSEPGWEAKPIPARTHRSVRSARTIEPGCRKAPEPSCFREYSLLQSDRLTSSRPLVFTSLPPLTILTEILRFAQDDGWKAGSLISDRLISIFYRLSSAWPSLHGKASHLVLRSLLSPANQVRLPPLKGRKGLRLATSRLFIPF